MSEVKAEDARTHELLERLVSVFEAGKIMANNLPSTEIPPQSAAKEAIAAPSKIEVCIEWLTQHPADAERTNRDLESNVMPMGIKVSRTYWGQAKKQYSAIGAEE